MTMMWPVDGGYGLSLLIAALSMRTNLNFPMSREASATASSEFANGPCCSGSVSAPHHQPSSTSVQRLKNSTMPPRTSTIVRLGFLIVSSLRLDFPPARVHHDRGNIG